MLPMRYDLFGSFPSLFSLRRDIDRLFGDFLKDFSAMTDLDLGKMGDVTTIAPRFDLVEKGDAYTLRADLPGVEPQDLKVQVVGNTLVLEGEKREERPEGEESGTERFRERVWRRYQRALTLPETIDSSRIEASLRSGVLTLVLPKSEEARPRQIEVKVDGGPERIEGAKGAAKQIEVKPEKKKEAA